MDHEVNQVVNVDNNLLVKEWVNKKARRLKEQ